MKKIWKYCKIHSLLSFAVVVLYILVSFLQVYRAIAIIRVADSAFNFEKDNFIQSLLHLGAIFIFIVILTYCRQKTYLCWARNIKLEIKKDIIIRIENFSIIDFDGEFSGNHFSELTNDMQRIDQEILLQLVSLISHVSSFLFATISLLKINILLTGSIISLSIILLILPKLIRKLIVAASQTYSDQQARYVGRIKHLLDGFETIKEKNASTFFVNSLESASQQQEAAQYKYLCLLNKCNILINGLSFFFQILIYVITAILIIQKKIRISIFTGVSELSGSILIAFQSASQALLSIKSGLVILNKVTEDIPQNLKKQVHSFKDCIELKNVSFQYPNQNYIFDDLNLKFKFGKKYLIQGRSGCGKSTLLKLLIGKLNPSKGIICIDGNDILSCDERSLFEMISYIPQEPYLFETDLEKNIYLSREGTLPLQTIKNILPRSKDGLVEHIGLSRGEMQRVELARILVKPTSIILMDEGTASLDKTTALSLEKLLLKKNCTLVMITHHLDNQLLPCFDQIIELPNLE